MSEKSDCPWCRGGGQYAYEAGKTRECTHPGPIFIREVPGATWQVTKWEAQNTPKPARPAKMYTPPKGGVYALFAKSLRKELPQAA